MTTNAFSNFWSWFESCLGWFFPPKILQDSFCMLIINGLEFIFGLWLLYILIAKPILMLIHYSEHYIYGGR